MRTPRYGSEETMIMTGKKYIKIGSHYAKLGSAKKLKIGYDNAGYKKLFTKGTRLC